MSWDQIPSFVASKVEENYQNLERVFFPDLTESESASNPMRDDGIKIQNLTGEMENSDAEPDETQEIVKIKSELRKQGNVKLTGRSQNQMKKKLGKNKVAPQPPPTKPGEDDNIPPPPEPFKPECQKECCLPVRAVKAEETPRTTTANQNCHCFTCLTQLTNMLGVDVLPFD